MLLATSALSADETFQNVIQPIFKSHCIQCHGQDNEDIKGETNLLNLKSVEHLIAEPDLIQNVIEVLDANDMPPEDGTPLATKNRAQLISSLKVMLRKSTAGNKTEQIPARRLNRFQYNYAIVDLFVLKKDVFALPEKLMTRHTNYLQGNPSSMPAKVNVSSQSLSTKGGFQDVDSFPQDLRAEHGFDNQADHLSLSPILLDSFLRLSVSILNSPDFTEQNCGIWDEFFKEPEAGSNSAIEISQRLKPFLEKAFRGPVDDSTVDRYSGYVIRKMNEGLSFTDSMKKGASAVLSSPLFLYRYSASDKLGSQFDLASNLSFFLWGSVPDEELLALAKNGSLSQPDVLNPTIDRMLASKKAERFLDSFPSQWLHLQSVLEAKPDPTKFRLYSLDEKNPASLQMLLEPLLLFDTVFVENRPLVDLISPDFSYQSDFLKNWYSGNPNAKTDEENEVEADRRQIANIVEQRTLLANIIKESQQELAALIEPVKEKLLKERLADTDTNKTVDLKPYASWEFDGNLKDSISSLDLTAQGEVSYEEGMVVLNKSYLQSKNLPIELKAKSFEVWFKLNTLKQSGGGVMTLQGKGDFFDSIVYGEIARKHWISGSNGHSRTLPFTNSTPETADNELLHLVMVYQEDGTTLLYRNGKPYGESFQKRSATFPKDQSSVLFGLRHLPAGGNKYLAMTLDKAQLYDRALTADEVAASSSGSNLYVSETDIMQELSPDKQAKKTALEKSTQEVNTALEAMAVPDLAQLAQDRQNLRDTQSRQLMRSKVFHRTTTSDPRYGGVMTNAAILTMTSSPKRTLPIARGSWVIEVLFNDPPPPPPNNVPPLNEEQTSQKLTIREKFAKHRENPDCAGCHTRLDPLGFALENFDVIGQWRDQYENGRDVDSSGTLMKKYDFQGIVEFKASLVQEDVRFAKAFTSHLLRFALSRELTAADSITVEEIVNRTEKDQFRLKSIIKQVILSKSFMQASK